MQPPALPKNELQRLQALRERALLDTPPEERFDRLTRLAKHTFGTEMALVSLVDAERQWFKSKQGLDACETGRDVSFCGHAILHDSILEVSDARLDPRFADNPLVTGTPHIRFYAGAPLSTSEGYHIGTLCIIDSQPRTLTPAEKLALRDLADCVEEEINQSAERRLQALLAASEAHKDAIIRALPDLVMVVNSNGVFLDSAEHADLIMPRAELIGKSLEQILPGDIAARGRQMIEQALASRSVQTFEYSLTIPSGPAAFEARFQYLSSAEVLVIIRNITAQKDAERALMLQKQLAEIIARAQSEFIKEPDRRKAFDGLLTDILALTDSVYGFIGEVLYTPDGKPYLKSYAITNIAWNDATRGFYEANAPHGLEFYNLKTLFGAAMTSGKAVIANDPIHDPRKGGLPEGHPALNAFLGAPIYHAGNMVAMLGLANRPTGYDDALIHFLNPLLATIGQLIDVARVQARHAEAQMEIARLSRVASQTTNAVIITDTAGQVEWINEGFTRISGYPLEEMLGRKPADLLQGPGTSQRSITRMRTALMQGESFELDILNYHKNGTPYWVHINCNPLRDEHGQLQGFMAIESDITQQKEVESQLNQFKNTLDKTLDCVFMFNARNLKFFYANEGGLQQVGYSMAELSNMHPYDIKPEMSRSKFLEMIQPLVNGEKPWMTFETIHQHKNGTQIPVEVFLQYIAHEDEPSRFVAVVRDITERKKNDRLKNEFISIVSHELRTPLTAISGALGLLAGGVLGPLPEKAQEMVSIASKNSQRLSYLINDLLDMEKLVAGKMHFDLQPQALLSVVQQSIEAHQPYGSERNVKINLSGQLPHVRVKVDGQRLLQVLANLLSNAIKYSPDNGEVDVHMAADQGHVRLSVTDHGPGIPAEFHRRIFQKFSQADSSDTRQRGGTGLGLAITKELVERMHGSIGFTSTKGEGASFYIDFPIY